MNGLGLCALLSARSAYQVIKHWYHKHRQNRRGHHAADHRRGNALRHFRAGSHAPHDGQQSRQNDCNCHSLGPHPHQQHRTFADDGRKMISNVNQHQCGVVPIARAPSRIRAVSREGCHDHRRLTLRSVLKHSVLVRKEQRSQDANDSKYFHNFSHFYSLLKLNPSRLG